MNRKKLYMILICICFFLTMSINVYAIFCIKCGAKNPDNAKFCFKCGTTLVKKNSPDKSKSNKKTISGKIYVTLGSGESNLQRGAEVFLVKDTQELSEDINKMKQIEEKIKEYNMKSIENDFGDEPVKKLGKLGMIAFGMGTIIRHSNEVDLYFSKSSFLSARSDAEGAYIFSDITLGSYYIYCRYKTNLDDGYWLLPVKARDNSAQAVDLSNHNLLNVKKELLLPSLETAKNRGFGHLKAMGWGQMELLNKKIEFEKVVLSTQSSEEAFPNGMTYPIAKSNK